MKELVADRLVVRCYEDRKQMGAAAALAVAEKIREELKSRDSLNMIFAAAPSQNEMLSTLLTQHIDWTRINAFHMDEYIGLPPGAPASFRTYLDEHLFSHVKFRSVHYLDGHSENVNEECYRYSNLLKTFPPDIVCMGIGENGHIAFNDPPVADFTDPYLVKPVELDEACRRQQVNDGCFPDIFQVPTHAITLTIPALISARWIFCVVPGKTKADAVFNTINQPIGSKFPSTILRQHPNAVLFVDNDSFSKSLKERML